jgi:exonuclease SbcC
VRRELELLAPLAQRAATLAALTERASVARAELRAATSSRDAAMLRVTGLRDATATHADDDAAFETLRLEHERAHAASNDADVALARAEVAATSAEGAMTRAEAARAELERAEARAAELARDRRLHDELDQAFTDLRTELNVALRPEVSRLASEFLTTLTNDRFTDLDLDDDYNLVLSEDGIPKPVISGGEEDVANLAVRLAISQMIAERTGQTFSLLILDEIFGSLDEARQRHVMSLLHALHDQFEQVILITHVGNIFDDGDRVLHVDLDPDTGASIVKEGEPLVDEHALLGAA